MNFTLDEIDVSGKEADRMARQIFVKIADGSYSEGRQLPSVRELAGKTSLTDYSARKVVSSLAKAGLVEVVSRKGMYVAAGAKKRAVGILKKYDYAFNSIDDETKKTTIAIADAFRFTDSYPQLRHPITISGIYSQASEKEIAVDLLRPDTDFTNSDAIMAQLKVGGYDGLIWLYPEEDRIDCIHTVSREIPVVLTSHSRTEFNLPAVESDESLSAVRVAKHFLSCNVPKVVQFVEPWVMRNGGAQSGGHISGINSLKLTLLGAGMSNYKLVEVGSSELKYRDILFETITTLEDGSGVFLANTDCFRAVMESDFYEIVRQFSRFNVVIGTTEIDNDALYPLAEEVDLFTCVNPLAKIGSISFQKVMNILDGLNEDTATIVRTSFGRFCELNIAKRHIESCAV